MALFDGILSGLGWIWDQTGGRVTSTLWDQITSGLVHWVVDAIAWFVSALLQFFQRSSTPDLASGWFAGGPIGAGARSPYGVVATIALALLLLCVLLSVVQGLAMGEGPAMGARLARDVPLAILGIVGTIGVTQVLLGAADEVSRQVLVGTQAGAHATQLLSTLGQTQPFGGQPSFVVFLLGLVAVLGAFLLWIELLVRASLVYILIALSPLAFAAFVWPAARRVLRRLLELVIALVLSKVVIAITLAVAASALAGGVSGTAIPDGEKRLGTLLVGTIMFLLASFSPFVVLRLVAVVESTTFARGVSHAPFRTAQTAMLTTLTVTRLTAATRSSATSASSTPTRPVAALGAPGSAGASPPDRGRPSPRRRLDAPAVTSGRRSRRPEPDDEREASP